MTTNLDTLATALYVRVDDALKASPELAPWRPPAGIAPTLSDAELVTLAVMSALLGYTSERRWLRRAGRDFRHLFPYLPQQSGYNKRLRAACSLVAHMIRMLAQDTSLWSDDVWVVDSTPVGCGCSRETARRSDLAGWAQYGYCASHSRPFWGLRLYLLCAPDGMPVSFCLAPANQGEREVAAAMLDRARERGMLDGGEIIVTDKGFASREFEQLITSLDATLIRPDRKDEHPRFGNLGRVRQWIESIINTTKSQLSLELHGGHIPNGVWARVCQRVLALAAGVWHSWTLWENGTIDTPGRHFTNYDH